MKVLVSEKLSEHKYKTPEGYLICTDAILARTGKQSYTKDELFQDGDDTEVNVDRPYDEVMNAKTIASFENKPITFDHPDEDVNVGNYKDYAIGYVRDVHQGKTDKGEDVILGNLVITDQDAINAIEQGDHTDLSCGYDCDIKDDGNGNYSQTNIRGNHLALCEQGRAGIAHIVDSKVKDANDYSWFKGYINGDLQSYNINSLINNVKSKQRPLHTNLTGKSGNVYTVFIDGSLKSNVDEGSNMWIDIIVEKPDGQQKRLVSEKFNSWNECQKIFNAFKNKVRDSKVEDNIKDMGWKTPGKRVPAHNEYSNSLKPEEMKSKLEKAAKDNKVDILRGILQELIADVDADLSNTSLDKDETIKHYNKYYAALRKANVGNMQGDVDSCLRELKRSGIHDSKKMTMSDAIKMLNIVDTYKKVKDAITWSEYEKEANKIIDDIIRYAKSIDKQAKVVRKDIKKEEEYTYSFFTVSIKTIKYKELEAFIKSKYSTNKFDSRPAYGIHSGYAHEALEVYYMSSYKKKIKDASKDSWVIKNTGLAYEVWNGGKLIKKFATKKQAIEWIHSRFPTDEITEDSTKDGRIWSTLTRKAKHR